LIRAIAFLIMCAAPAAAQDVARLDKIEAAWRGWLEGNRVGKSTLAITYQKDVVHEVSRGGRIEEPAPLASLSKAITAACVADLVADGVLGFDTRVSDYLVGPDRLTVADLLTHSGGLRPDQTQQTMWDWVNDPVDRHADASQTALARATVRAGAYHYNNENYAVLGSLVEAVTGQPFQEVCENKVLAPLNLTSPRRSPRYGAFLSWGGWEMSAGDYARFAISRFGSDTPYGQAPVDFPSVPLGQGINYGLGVLFFEAEGQRFFWHFGLLCFGAIDGAGAYFALYGPDYGVALTFEGCPGEAALTELDQVLAAAVLR